MLTYMFILSWFPQETIVPEYRERPLLYETDETDIGTDEIVMAASDTDVNEAQAEKKHKFFRKVWMQIKLIRPD